MSDNGKKDFEFIKEQVIEKKRKKFKKRVMPLLMTICLAIIFGIVAAVTFVLAEPKLYELLHNDKETKVPTAFPTEYPEETVVDVEVDKNDDKQTEDPKDDEVIESSNENQEPDTVIIERPPIDADIDDYRSIYEELRKLSLEVEKSLVTVVSINDETDVWFGTNVELVHETSGLIFYNDSINLLILVSYDRIKDADAIKIQLSDNFTVDAVIQDYDKELNLAMLSVPLESIPVTYMGSLQVAKLGESYTLAVGSPILALGSPNGHTGSMEAGMISGRNSYAYITDNKLDLFNTDITDNPNSDGIIVNMKGEVIGLITRTLKGEQNEGLSTAVGISKIRLILGNMVNKIARNYVGVKTLDMPEAAKKEYKVENGIYVNEVIEDSPAFDAGIQNGDIILQIDDNTVINTNSFFNFISAYVQEDEILIKILRTTGSTQREMDIKLTIGVKEN
jgi:S1-C subfamily serine protease